MKHEFPAIGDALIPRATYRIQFHAGMRFTDATELVPYLDALGISHLYASPYLSARVGSTHGYDIVDHNAVNAEIGSDAEHAALCDALAARGMYQLLDIVPNHMGVLQADNAWWLDVLECGVASAHAQTFDIDWQPSAPEMAGRVLVPVLGDQYGRVLEAGELTLAFDADKGSFAVHYFDHRFPIDPQHYPDIIGTLPVEGIAPRELMEAQGLIESFARLPARDAPGACEGRADKPLLQRRLAQHVASQAWLGEAIGAALAAFDIDRLDALIARQAWRPAFWRVSGDDVNYRRFFDIDTLAALRMERNEVFEATHRTVLRWLAEGRAHGLRVDHPDGLADPRAYLERLQQAHAQALTAVDREPRSLYVIVEKILAEHEHLPREWATHGGTGYRFANLVHGLFVQSRHEAAFDDILQRFTADDASFDAVLDEAKRLIMSTSLAADLQLLTEALYRVAQAHRHTRDFTRNRLRLALVEMAAAYPVYRSYVSADGVPEASRRDIEWAAARARRNSAARDTHAIAFVHDVLLGAPDEPDAGQRQRKLAFVTRWQQFTAPVMAKAMEDTAFYRYHRLVSLNDVGGDPRRFGVSTAAFHAANAARLRRHPHAMLATSTHDSKRSEDVRARLAVLSEMPQAWNDAVMRWSETNRAHAARADTTGVQIGAADEYLLYQTLVGIWPFAAPDFDALDALRQRVQAYLLKAAREAKLNTSWINPNQAYEAAVAQFIDRLLGVPDPNPFLTDLNAFVQTVLQPGCINGLNQLLFKLTAPGVPDLYQGCERWCLQLVDPDNRRPVDFAALQDELQVVRHIFSDGPPPTGSLRSLLEQPADGRIKLLLTWRLLSLRREQPALFEQGDYVSLSADGPASEHVVAFMRSHGDVRCVVVGSRWPWTLRHALATREIGWRGTTLTLPPGEWVDAVSGRAVDAGKGEVALDALWNELPVAVLIRTDAA